MEAHENKDIAKIKRITRKTTEITFLLRHIKILHNKIGKKTFNHDKNLTLPIFLYL